MRWDVFCKVIDNHGDLGVCWRLACDLAARGEQARLWIDDASALAWMAPRGREGVEVIDWSNPEAVGEAVARAAPDILVEAFGCDPEPALLARFADAHRDASTGVWINLEYLSAEPYVERLHGLPSPVFKGPGAGRPKYFFYPGFTDRTGGLLREPGLPGQRAAFDRTPWLAARGIPLGDERLVSLFCYEPPALESLLHRLREGSRPTRLLVTAGRATAALPPGTPEVGALKITWLPYLSQVDYDHLLWSCDLNFVRGEDSWVRAFWAGAPFVWQIYPQDDDAHHVKLEAFMDWMRPPVEWRRAHRVWNGMQAGEMPALDEATLDHATRATRDARQDLLGQQDLTSRLMQFVRQKQ
ncbi:Elongation factor P maturation arginine rhamnosyltransferase EarP [Burkholderiales bacterium 8X]|nr:Elongation factor P maturation arginine rhamnosyltransferase EarP [Burkholderiales bacterium 8X]